MAPGALGQCRGKPFVCTRTRTGDEPEQVTHNLCTNVHVLPENVPGQVELVKPDVQVTLVPLARVIFVRAVPPHVVEN